MNSLLNKINIVTRNFWVWDLDPICPQPRHGSSFLRCLLVYVIWTTRSGAVSHRFNNHIPGCDATQSGGWMDLVPPSNEASTSAADWTDEIQIWRRWLWIIVTRIGGKPRTSGTYLLTNCYASRNLKDYLKWKAEDYTFTFYA